MSISHRNSAPICNKGEERRSTQCYYYSEPLHIKSSIDIICPFLICIIHRLMTHTAHQPSAVLFIVIYI